MVFYQLKSAYKIHNFIKSASGQTIIIMEIRKAPTLRLRALNKHNITHIMYIKMENGISDKKYLLTKI